MSLKRTREEDDFLDPGRDTYLDIPPALPDEIWKLICWQRRPYCGNGGSAAVPMGSIHYLDEIRRSVHINPDEFQLPTPHPEEHYFYIHYHIGLAEHIALARTCKDLHRAIGRPLDLIRHALSCLATQRSPADADMSAKWIFQLADAIRRPRPLERFIPNPVYHLEEEREPLVLHVATNLTTDYPKCDYTSRKPKLFLSNVMAITGSRVVASVSRLLHDSAPQLLPVAWATERPSDKHTDLDIFTAVRYWRHVKEVEPTFRDQFNKLAYAIRTMHGPTQHVTRVPPTMNVHGSGTIVKLHFPSELGDTPMVDLVSPAAQPYNVVAPDRFESQSFRGAGPPLYHREALIRKSLLYQVGRFHSGVAQCCILPCSKEQMKKNNGRAYQYYLSPLCYYAMATHCNIPMGFSDVHCRPTETCYHWQDSLEMTQAQIEKWTARGFEHLPQPLAHPAGLLHRDKMGKHMLTKAREGREITIPDGVIYVPRLFRPTPAGKTIYYPPQYQDAKIPAWKLDDRDPYRRLMLIPFVGRTRTPILQPVPMLDWIATAVYHIHEEHADDELAFHPPYVGYDPIRAWKYTDLHM